MELNQDGIRRTAYQLLSYPSIGWSDLARVWPELAAVSLTVRERLETDATYAVYLDRQQADIAAYRRDEGVVLDEGIDFQGLPGLSNEIKAKLDLVRPKTLGQAARIEGITPAALTLLAAHARKAPGRHARDLRAAVVTRSADGRPHPTSNVSRETFEKLELLERELRRWQAIKNLVGPATLDPDLGPAHRRFAPASRPCARGQDLARPRLRRRFSRSWSLPSPARSGGLQVHLVESNSRKCAFLRHIARLTGAAATIHEARLETVIPGFVGKADVVSARALAVA